MTTNPTILVINSGSSSLKLGLFQPTAADVHPRALGAADGIGSQQGKISLRSSDDKSLYDSPHSIDDQPHASPHSFLLTAFPARLPSAIVSFTADQNWSNTKKSRHKCSNNCKLPRISLRFMCLSLSR